MRRLLPLAIFLTSCSSPIAPDEHPRIIYSSSHGEYENDQAVTRLLLEESGTGVSRNGDAFVLRLPSHADGKTRTELLEIASNLMRLLRDDYPCVIEVQTVEDAVEDRRKTIAMYEREIEAIQTMHREGSE